MCLSCQSGVNANLLSLQLQLLHLVHVCLVFVYIRVCNLNYTIIINIYTYVRSYRKILRTYMYYSCIAIA